MRYDGWSARAVLEASQKVWKKKHRKAARRLEASPTMQRVSMALESFRATGSTAERYTLHHISELPGEWVCEAALRELEHRLIENLQSMMATPVVIVRRVQGDGEARSRVIVVIKAQMEGFCEANFEHDALTLEGTLVSLGLLPNLTCSIRGSLDGILDSPDAHGLVHIARRAVGAREIEKMDSNGCLSVSAYTKKGPRPIWTGTSPMNLQFAVHADENRGRTNVFVGTPILREAY